MTRIAMAATGLVCAGLIGCSGGPTVGAPAPGFEAADAEGRVVELASYAGKVTVLDFWATWCGRCRVASPHVQALHERYEGNARVAIVGVHKDVDYRKGHPAAYMEEHGYTFDLIPDGRAVAEAYGVRALPQLVIIDGDGMVIHSQFGFGADDVDAFAEIIDGELASAER